MMEKKYQLALCCTRKNLKFYFNDGVNEKIELVGDSLKVNLLVNVSNITKKVFLIRYENFMHPIDSAKFYIDIQKITTDIFLPIELDKSFDQTIDGSYSS